MPTQATSGAPAAAESALRIDKLLWYLRLSPSRARGRALAEEGHVRLNGRRVDRAHSAVRAGDLIVFPWGAGSRIVRVIRLPRRRGPPAEARDCYEEIVPGGTEADAAAGLPAA